ncbi:MAG: hypothetical protein QOH84_1514 [Kribbellaceae bacterium]|nr:hypothetical protein [Kribbellaceae bacterium]
MSLKSIKLGAFAAVSAVAGTLIFAAVPASASTAASTANPPYDGCPGWALCLYENGGGLGSKLVLTPPPAGSGDQIVHLVGKHFLNGDSADNATSSWLNNSQCSVTFWDDPSGELHPSDVDYAPAWTWGRTADYSFGTPSAYRNDRISSLRFGCW